MMSSSMKQLLAVLALSTAVIAVPVTAQAAEKAVSSIEEGKKADLILIDMEKPHLYPVHNIISSLAYSVQGSDVDTVIIDGKIIMENREMKTLDVEEIMFNVDKIAKDLINR